jgi:hypothetical protein
MLLDGRSLGRFKGSQSILFHLASSPCDIVLLPISLSSRLLHLIEKVLYYPFLSYHARLHSIFPFVTLQMWLSEMGLPEANINEDAPWFQHAQYFIDLAFTIADYVFGR